MTTLFLISFLMVFGLILLSVSLGLKVYEAHRARRMAELLRQGDEPLASIEPSLLSERDTPQNWAAILLDEINSAGQLKTKIQQAGLDWSANKLLLLMGIAAIVGYVFGVRLQFLFFSQLSGLAGAIGFGLLPYFFVLRKRSKRFAEFEEQFPEALDFLARSMRAGHAFTVSLEMLGEESPEPLSEEFRAVFNEQNLGAPLDVALKSMVARVPLIDVRFFVSSVLLQKQTGGNLSEILTRLAYVIRERFRLRGQVRAASAHGRMTATILTALPFVTMLALMVVAPGYLQSMAMDPDGQYLIIGALLAQGVGYFFIRRIIRIKV